MSNTHEEDFSEERIQGMFFGFWISKVLFTAIELGIFDELSKGSSSSEVLAYKLRLHSSALPRLLNALVAVDLLVFDGIRYSNSKPTQRFLVTDSPDYLGGHTEHLSHLQWRLWQFLPDAIRENSPRVSQVFGSGFDMMQNVYADLPTIRSFARGMHNLSLLAAKEIVEAFDFNNYRCLMDVGGGSGALAIAATQRHNELNGIVFELPQVCLVADHYIQSHDLGDRIKTISGDFFETDSLPNVADVISLGWVLHDWSDKQCDIILRNCFKALEPNGAILVCEKLLDEERTGPLQATLLDLQTLVSTGGQERPSSVYSDMLERIGFVNISVQVLRGNRDLIIAQKPIG